MEQRAWYEPEGLADAINSLPEGERIVFTLAYYEGQTDAEIAAALSTDEGEVSALHDSAVQRLIGLLGIDESALRRGSQQPIHPTYLPFTDEVLRQHFAPVRSSDPSEIDTHLAYYRLSANRYSAFRQVHPLPSGLPVHQAKSACQIEKDERFWVVATLMAYFHHPQRIDKLATLLSRAFGPRPPIEELTDWRECFTDDLRLYFEANLPSPPSFRTWLGENIEWRQPVPYVVDAASARGEALEGPTRVDAILLDPSTGCAVLFEAKVLSDCSYQVTFDGLRNQIARNIDVMLDWNATLASPLSERHPDRSLFALLTPEVFREHPESRLYGWLMNDYKGDPTSLARDLSHRHLSDEAGSAISSRLGWLTWEDCSEVLPGACPWLTSAT